MDFTIPEELTALRKTFATFLDREVRPVEESVLEDLTGLDPDRDGSARRDRRVRKRSAEEGFYACYLPEAVGGWGVSTLGTALLVEDAARSGLRLAPLALGVPSPSGPTPDAAAAARAPAGRRT